ncbi:hypothetical protein FMUND_10797 [Fusarium mundagurra]|uniref:Uncharacterized protein n=1 Tax=Fusarium mundagurra TaxID=1567541 RepID=A0A8H5Y9A6_9HYPO|nr:hypothetical protein FMUND_10797 [Fusarium mundagurra]
MAKIKSHKDFKPFSAGSDSHWPTPDSEAQKNGPVEESTVAQDTNEMEGIEGPAAKRRALSTGKLNSRFFEYRDLQDRTRRKTECPSNPSNSVESTCSLSRGRSRDGRPHRGGFHHNFQVRIRNLSPIEDEPELKDDDLLPSGQSNN